MTAENDCLGAETVAGGNASAGALAPPMIDPLSRVLWLLFAGLGTVLSVAVALSDFTIADIHLAAAHLCSLVLIGWLLRKRGMIRAGTLLEALAQFLLIVIVSALLILVAAGTALPYRDAELASIDKMMFSLDWAAVSVAMTSWPHAGFALSYAYSTIDWQPFALISLLIAFGRLQRLRIFLLAWALSLAIVIVIFPFVPAAGAYLHYGIGATEMPGVLVNVGWRHIEILQPIRDGTLRGLHFATFAGIVTFPSFHAAAAILLGWGFWAAPLVKWPALILNVLMFVSCIPIGAHYIVDLIAGAAIAYVALVGARRVAASVGPRADQDTAISFDVLLGRLPWLGGILRRQ